MKSSHSMQFVVQVMNPDGISDVVKRMEQVSELATFRLGDGPDQETYMIVQATPEGARRLRTHDKFKTIDPQVLGHSLLEVA